MAISSLHQTSPLGQKGMSRELVRRTRLHLLFVYKPLLALLGIAAFWLLPISTTRDFPQQITFLLVVYGDMLAPAVVGGVACGLIMNDPCRELMLATPSRLWFTTLSRLAVLILGVWMIWGQLVLLSWLLVMPQALSIAVPQLILSGFVSQLAFASLGLWIALRLRSAVSGGVVIAAAWAGPLLAREAFLNNPVGLVLFPFITLFDPAGPLWLSNRLLLGVLGLGALVLAARLTLDEEPLVLSSRTREDVG